MEKKGVIALDIDGTITHDKFRIAEEIRDYLLSLQKSGWLLVLSTGRTHSFAKKALSCLNFPFLFCGQNGSVTLQFPEDQILFKHYLTYPVIAQIEEAFEGISGNFIVYAGYEKKDACYYKKSRFTDRDLQYVFDLQQRQSEEWNEVHEFEPSYLKEIPLIKCFGSRISMQRLQNKLQSIDSFETALVQDPFNPDYSLLLTTAKNVSKGSALKEILEKFQIKFCIAAGDDENDFSMLEQANVKIAIDTAPKSLMKIADIIAKPPKDFGIIEALKQAIEKK